GRQVDILTVLAAAGDLLAVIAVITAEGDAEQERLHDRHVVGGAGAILEIVAGIEALGRGGGAAATGRLAVADAGVEYQDVVVDHDARAGQAAEQVDHYAFSVGESIADVS